MRSAPVHVSGRGGSPDLFFSSVPETRGMARRQGARSRLLWTGPGVRLSRAGPDTPGPGREASRPAPCGAPPRHLGLSPLTVVGPGRLVVTGEVARVPPGVGGCVVPRSRVPLPFPTRTTPHESAPQRNGMGYTYSEVNPLSTEISLTENDGKSQSLPYTRSH